MPDDNMQNDDLNQPNNFGAFDDSSSTNPVPQEPFDAAMPEDTVISEPDFNQNASNYDFNEIQDNESDVRINSSSETKEPVTIRPVEFSAFDSYTPTNTDTNKNLELLMDIKLELTVELGRCHLPVKKVLELTRGSIIELDKVAGESVELYANGKHVANGEVVVIEDNFGLRITSITDPEERIKSL